MDLRKLKTLIDLVSESNISELEITEAEVRELLGEPVAAVVRDDQRAVDVPARTLHHLLGSFRLVGADLGIELRNLSNKNNVDYDSTNKVMQFRVVAEKNDAESLAHKNYVMPTTLFPDNEVMTLDETKIPGIKTVNTSIVSDTRKVVYYYRASPDRTRILFGGRASFVDNDARRASVMLRGRTTWSASRSCWLSWCTTVWRARRSMNSASKLKA